MIFPAKYTNKCANGHQIDVGDYIAFNDQNQVLCTQCPDFATGRHTQEVIYSKVYCSGCFIELSIAEKDMGKVKCADCEQ